MPFFLLRRLWTTTRKASNRITALPTPLKKGFPIFNPDMAGLRNGKPSIGAAATSGGADALPPERIWQKEGGGDRADGKACQERWGYRPTCQPYRSQNQEAGKARSRKRFAQNLYGNKIASRRVLRTYKFMSSTIVPTTPLPSYCAVSDEALLNERETTKLIVAFTTAPEVDTFKGHASPPKNYCLGCEPAFQISTAGAVTSSPFTKTTQREIPNDSAT